jgi:hypothetical protein
VAASAFAGLASSAAEAELVGEFNARVKNIKLGYGGYTAVFDSRVYDTTGAPPPPLQSAQVHFPRGASIRPEFLRGGYFCDTAKLEQTANPAVCAKSKFASGEILLDARPAIAEAIPSSIYLFLTRARDPGATAAVAVLVVSNDRTPVYTSQVLFGSLFPDQGVFGYRMLLPTTIKPLVPGLRLSLAELSLTVKGLTLTKKTKRSKHGKRARTRKLFWTKVPRCTAKKQVTFAADYRFETANPIYEQRTVKCSRFIKRPSQDGSGKVPGS